MKNYVLFFLSVVLFMSCKNSPDNIIHDQRSEKGDWVYDSVAKTNVQKDVTYYKIAPTWGQASAFANQRGDRAFTIILGIIFLTVFVGLFVGQATDASWLPKVFENVNIFMGALFLSIVFSVYFFFGDASSVKWNNDKWIQKEVYDEAMKSGSTQPIWDSLQNNCLIVDGPYNCYK